MKDIEKIILAICWIAIIGIGIAFIGVLLDILKELL